MSSLTFVTSFFYIYEREYDEKKTIPWRIERFREIARTGIKLCIYVCPILEKYIKLLCEEFPDNIQLMKTISIEDTIVGRLVSEINYESSADGTEPLSLPNKKKVTKDVSDYMIVINSKTEFMAHTVENNPWNSTHFAWIDFNISHVFFDKPLSIEYLTILGKRDYFEPNCFVIPGCWDKYNNEYIGHITETIHWRFCGGFLLGDAMSILKFHELYNHYLPLFLKEYRRLVWEVNFWAWLEANSDWNPKWYKADHNDTIINSMWAATFSQSLKSQGSEVFQYDYPKVDGYNPSSAAYLFHKGKHLLNTRYVNYWYYNNGGYMFYDGTNIIRTKNVFSNLNYAEGCAPEYQRLIPQSYTEMEETIDLPKHDFYSRGIEDLRLYAVGDKVKYIATTVGYHTTCGNRMVIGDYCIDTFNYANSFLVHPPTETFLEKNWVPLVLNNPASPYHERELFIYRWGPLEIGEIYDDPETNTKKLEIIQSYPETALAPFFKKMRGSALMVDTGKSLIGVIHFSEETKPRHYFHVMIELDRTTLEPLRYSDPFYFESVNIEFCIGFDIKEDNYWFWISRMDRDPLLIKMNREKIPFTRTFPKIET